MRACCGTIRSTASRPCSSATANCACRWSTRAVDSGVKVTIFARDVSIALSRPMDVSITNRLPGTILAVEPQALPYVRVVFNLGVTQLDALVTTESVERLGLEPGLRAWAMIKTVAIGKDAVEADLPQPRRWPVLQKTDRETR